MQPGGNGIDVPNWIGTNFVGVLPELKVLPNWVLAKAVLRNGTLTKPPFQPNGRPASHSDPATWSPFGQVRSAFVRGGYIGVGFVLDGRPHFGGKFLHGFDWDTCINNGATDPAVMAAVKRLRLPRLEVSVSGTGLRGFFLHDEPLQSRRTKIDGRSVELYSTARYLTTTGWALGCGADLAAGANLSAILDLFSASPIRGGTPARAPTIAGACSYDLVRAGFPNALTAHLTDVIDAVRFDPRWAALYAGDLSAYAGDHSAGDLALCGEFARRGLDALMIDTAMRTSALYRDKWERDDYRQRTIALALSSASAKPPVSSSLLHMEKGRIDASTAPPPPREWVVDGMVLASKAAVLAGFGGSSKTQASLQLAIAVATGVPFAGRATKPGHVIFISGEEDREEIQRRVNAVIRHESLSLVAIDAIRANLRAFPLVGDDLRLTAPDHGALKETELRQRILTAAREAGGVSLIVLDHVGLLHGGDFNAREDASMTMRVINGIAQETGAAVILLAHSPKNAAGQEESDASMIAGSTAFVDQARAGWIMAKMRQKEAKKLGIPEAARKEYVSLVGVKANYAPDGDAYWFRRISFDEVGVLANVQLHPPVAAKAGADLQANIIGTVRNAPGQYAKTRLRELFAGKTKNWRASKAEIDAEVETLLADGKLINRPPTAAEKAKYGHGPQVKHVLDLGQ